MNRLERTARTESLGFGATRGEYFPEPRESRSRYPMTHVNDIEQRRL